MLKFVFPVAFVVNICLVAFRLRSGIGDGLTVARERFTLFREADTPVSADSVRAIIVSRTSESGFDPRCTALRGFDFEPAIFTLLKDSRISDWDCLVVF